MKTWHNINLGISLFDEIKRKDSDKEWIVIRIDYPPRTPGKIFIHAVSKDSEVMQEFFNPDLWVKSGINYLVAFKALVGNMKQIEQDYLNFFKEID